MVFIFKDFFAFFRNQIKVVYVLEETNFGNISGYMRDINSTNIVRTCILGGDINILMKGKLFQRSTHFLYCSVLSLGGNVTQDGCRSLTWDPSFT